MAHALGKRAPNGGTGGRIQGEHIQANHGITRAVIRVRNIPEFRAALKLALKLGKRTEAELLNKWGGEICLRAYKHTKKADPQAIKARLYRDALAIRLIYSRAEAKGKRLTLAERNTATRKLIRSRMRAARYVAVGFLQAAKGFGKAQGTKINPKSFAARGYGIKATANRLRALIGNNATGADVIAEDPLQRAIREIASEEIAYATRQLQKQFNKVSGRRGKR